MNSFEINLPLEKYIYTSHTSTRISLHSKCLLSLNSRNDITVSRSKKLVGPPRLRDKKGVADRNGKCASFFSVNDNLFMILDTDCPDVNVESWSKYYTDKGVKAFFVINYYKHLQGVFQDLNVTVFPLFSGPNVDCLFVDDDDTFDHAPLDKVISVFFVGKFQNNSVRYHLAQSVKSSFSNSYIRDTYAGFVDSASYLDILKRSKIVWSPPSVQCRSFENHPQYAMYMRDREAMYAESLLVRPPIDIFTPTKLINEEHFVETNRDNSNLIAILQKYLSDEANRLRIARNGRMFFEKNCTPMARANYILEKCISVIS